MHTYKLRLVVKGFTQKCDLTMMKPFADCNAQVYLDHAYNSCTTWLWNLANQCQDCPLESKPSRGYVHDTIQWFRSY